MLRYRDIEVAEAENVAEELATRIHETYMPAYEYVDQFEADIVEVLLAFGDKRYDEAVQGTLQRTVEIMDECDKRREERRKEKDE